MKAGTFRNTQWDPMLLITQIISMQSCIYFTLGLLVFFANILAGDNYTLDNVFEYHEIHISDAGGRLIILAFVLNSFVASLALWFIVRRAKLCLDFSCTFHFIHLLICWWYNSNFPSNVSWWLLNAITTTLMCIGGEFLCLKSELKEIPVGYAALNQKSDV
ncbi:protein SYS1 homolog [Anastrepha obliqua]|uniref:protein SYS1 homolog n=1 Tax=Anastrepha ludens TaxID=28586 RepID=UPI0023AFB6C2|nr:protein SYS1 homolog [Anastrepha ludens]XP_054745255.1 protein SYS1 homolog [Anastrepha obliqua]